MVSSRDSAGDGGAAAAGIVKCSEFWLGIGVKEEGGIGNCIESCEG